MENHAINILSTCISTLSLLFTICALIICVTQQCWKKRDGVLLFNIFVIDILFSCIVISINVHVLITPFYDILRGVILSNIFVFIFLISWASQCLIAINRYVVIIFPFTYKKILRRKRLCIIVSVMWFLTFVACILSGVLCSVPPKLFDDAPKAEYQLIFLHLSKTVIIVLSALHVFFLLIIFIMECYLWKIARGHQTRYRSITHFVSSKEDTPPENKGRKLSISQSIQKRLSFSTQQQRMAVRRTPFLLLGAHFAAILPYIALAFIYVINNKKLFHSKSYVYLCMFLLVVNSIRPIMNVFNHVSSNKMKKFKLLLQRLRSKQSAELCTEYYIENQKEVENLFKLRRESAHSIVTEGSIV